MESIVWSKTTVFTDRHDTVVMRACVRAHMFIMLLNKQSDNETM